MDVVRRWVDAWFENPDWRERRYFAAPMLAIYIVVVAPFTFGLAHSLAALSPVAPNTISSIIGLVIIAIPTLVACWQISPKQPRQEVAPWETEEDFMKMRQGVEDRLLEVVPSPIPAGGRWSYLAEQHGKSVARVVFLLWVEVCIATLAFLAVCLSFIADISLGYVFCSHVITCFN